MFPCKSQSHPITPRSPRSDDKADRLAHTPWQRIVWIVLLAMVVPSAGLAYKTTFHWVGDWETMDHLSALKIYSMNAQYIRFEINTRGAHNSGMMLGKAHFDTDGHVMYHYPEDGKPTCTVEFKPVAAHLEISANANSAACGLGLAVSVDGTYYRWR